jgi:hypothetical protein
MMIAGFAAVCAILLGPSFSQNSASESHQKAKTEKSSEQQGPVIQAPTEAIPGTAVKLDEPAAPLLTLIEEEQPQVSHPVISSEQITRYLKVLFRTAIASNAP